MPSKSLLDRLARQLRPYRSQQPGESEIQEPNRRQPSSGILSGAHNFVINNPTFVDNLVAGNPSSGVFSGASDFVVNRVLEYILPYADLDATMDSSARFPPPSCHPGTRSKIGDRLFKWLMDPKRQWSMIWLHGPACTGKSAVAQTFAERCARNGRLGASFFFSRPDDRSNPDTVIPSLIYQLAVRLPHYKSLVTAQLAQDPELLRKPRPTLFKRLIINPLLQLQTQKRGRIQEPLLIILDGLDECKGEDAQHDFIEMISEVVRLKHDFPLVWLICSRSEAHLKYLFSRSDLTVSCGREKLEIDAESIADVDLYLRDGLAGIKDHFGDVTTSTWPPEEQVNHLSRKASGYFGFASAALLYISDLTYADPMTRLNHLLSFLEGVRVGESNPLEALDALYTGIFLGVPDENFLTIKRILGYYIYCGNDGPLVVCNFFNIDQATFYRVIRKLHSVLDVPSPDVASDKPLHFYHPSFVDYLRDPSRSGQFAIRREDFYLEFAKSCLSWYKTDLALFHSTHGSVFNASHLHGILPGLLWVSDDNRAYTSYIVAHIAEGTGWFACNQPSKWDEDLLSQIRHFDFRYIRKDGLGFEWCNFVNKLWKVDHGSNIIRTEPRSEVDRQLLECMKSMIEPVRRCRPATFPLNWLHSIAGEYFLLGYDSQAVVCWTTGRREGVAFGALSSNEVPSKEQTDAYQAWLVEKEDSDGSGEEKGSNKSGEREERESVEGGKVKPNLIHIAWQRLKERCLSGAELPPGWYPPLGYHPETRKNLREKIAAWLDDAQRDWTVLWLTGPAGVGKTVVAQTVAEDCRRIGRLGAAISASEVDDLDQAIFTLIYQLAVQHQKYRELIARKLAADPTILERGGATDRLETLFTQPLLHLKNQDPDFLRSPSLFIFDMEGDNFRNNLGFLISQITTLTLKGRFRFLLVICSRYEQIYKLETEQQEREEKLSFDDMDARQGVRHVLYDGFGNINRLFPDLLPPGAETWPSRGQVDIISSISSGFFPFALSVLNFVGNPEFRDPVTRLNTCVDLIQNPGNVEETHPLYPLFLFYQNVLASPPRNLLDHPLVHFYLHFPGSNFMTQDLANFFLLGQDGFYSHAELLIPAFHSPGPSEAISQGFRPHHSSLDIFLRQSDFGKGGYAELITRLIRWHSICLMHRCELKGCETWPKPTWQYHTSEEFLSFVTRVKELMRQAELWAECATTWSHLAELVVEALTKFKFCHLKQIDVRPGYTFRKFLAWLLNLGTKNAGLIRYQPSSETDELLAKKYDGPWLKLPLDHTGEYYVISLHHTEPIPPPTELIFTHAKQHQYVKRVNKGMCWLGQGTRTCLIVAYEERITVLSEGV